MKTSASELAEVSLKSEEVCLSIIIPVLNEGDRIAECLRTVRHSCADNIEIIVVDGGSEDETVNTAKQLANKVINAPRGRANQMNVGAKVASGEYLLFLHADTVLPKDLPKLIEQWQLQKTMWGFFAVRLSGQHWLLRWVERLMNVRSRFSGIGTGDQCLFVEKDSFERVGGFPQQPLMEDIELCKRLKRICPCSFQKLPVITSSRRWEENGISRTVFQMWALRLAYFLGVSSQKLAEIYYPGVPVVSDASDYIFTDSCIVQFAKMPVAGKVKTRLQPVLGEQGCLSLHKKLLEHQFKQLQPAKVAPLELWFNGETNDVKEGCGQESCSQQIDTKTEAKIEPSKMAGPDGYFESLVCGTDASLGVQKGDSLGDRMRNCFCDRLSIYQNVVLIGSDCPAIDGDYITEAIDALSTGSEAVFGPALDGGYVLVGLSRMTADKISKIFSGVDWGTDLVMEQTRQNLLSSGLRWKELPLMQDIDREEDLPALAGYINLHDLLCTEEVVL